MKNKKPKKKIYRVPGVDNITRYTAYFFHGAPPPRDLVGDFRQLFINSKMLCKRFVLMSNVRGVHLVEHRQNQPTPALAYLSQLFQTPF